MGLFIELSQALTMVHARDFTCGIHDSARRAVAVRPRNTFGRDRAYVLRDPVVLLHRRREEDGRRPNPEAPKPTPTIPGPFPAV